jgi:cellulose synthase/poly-beta-1,6-N-acetylglucosamine synthase-like glycosyltransferase
VPILHALLYVAGICLLLPTLPLSIELLVLTIAALFPARKIRESDSPLKLAVIIPAHNEEQLIAACVVSLQPTTAAIYVVAHNCTDATAANAASAGAQVLRLDEDSGHGKGAALHFGFAQALAAGAEAVLVMDADSVASPNLIDAVRSTLAGGSRALQVRYEAAQPTTGRTRLQALALRGMNVVRPLGRARLRLSCGVFGNGFALTATTLKSVPYFAHSVVEDLEYHLLLVRAGIRVDFLNTATVRAELPTQSNAAATQSARWEGGRILMRRKLALPLLREVLSGHLRLFEPLLDLLALPLATNAALLVLALLVPVFNIRFDAACGLCILLFYVLVSALLGDNPIRDALALVEAPFYMLFKLANFSRTRGASNEGSTWIRTDRNRPD